MGVWQTSVDVLHEVVQRAWATSPPPPTALVWGGGLLALVLVAWDGTWRVVRHAVTIAHEGAHAVVATACGRSLQGIRLHSDTSGLTISRGSPRGAGMVATTAAGYVGPSLVGLGAAALVAAGRPAAVCWAVLLALGLLLLQLRNAFGALVVGVCAALAFAASWWAPAPVEQVAAQVLAWVMLLGGLRAVGELARSRRGGRAPASDPDALRRLTGVPALVWVVGFALTDAAALGLGGWWLAG